jgi:hypothetical protein
MQISKCSHVARLGNLACFNLTLGNTNDLTYRVTPVIYRCKKISQIVCSFLFIFFIRSARPGACTTKLFTVVINKSRNKLEGL